MIKKCLIGVLCFLLLSCSNNMEDLLNTNKKDYVKLVDLLKKNDDYFFDNTPKNHRVFYTSSFEMTYEELPKENVWNEVDRKLYMKLREFIQKLKIDEFYVSSNGNYFFKIRENDFFVKSNNYYLGFSEKNNIEIDMTSFGGCKIHEYNKIENNWYSVVCSSSPAN